MPSDAPKPCGCCVMFEPYMREMKLATKWENEALRLRVAMERIAKAVHNGPRCHAIARAALVEPSRDACPRAAPRRRGGTARRVGPHAAPA